MKMIAVTAGILLSLSMTSYSAAEEATRRAPDEVLAQLLAGNKRYSEGEPSFHHQSVERRGEIAKGQNPVAAVLSCSDSRVPPEVIFDHGLGDLFVVRIAGHVLDNTALASLEYAVEHLGVSLIMVLGHERCGAVTAAVSGGHLPGHLTALTEKIRPVVEAVGGGKTPDVEECIDENARLVARQLNSAKPVLAKFVKSDELKIVAGKYDLDTGTVTVLEH